MEQNLKTPADKQEILNNWLKFGKSEKQYKKVIAPILNLD